jgi:hypothetical protein
MASTTTPVLAAPRAVPFHRLVRLCLLLLPALLLSVAAERATDRANLLWLGAGVELVGCVFALAGGPGWQGPADLAVIVLYVTGFSYLIGAGPGPDDWYGHVALAVLLVVPLGCFGRRILHESGAPALRQARVAATRLARRTEWPDDLAECRNLPEVVALRDALHIDASPALALLNDPRPQVRVGALAALEYRQRWRPGQPDLVLQMARNSPEPEIRAAAVRALANLADRELVEGVSEFLYDPSGRVRRAAGEALLGDPEGNWAWVRPAVRRALSEPLCQNDGPLCPEGGELSPEAVADLTAWAAEKGLLGLRAAVTLGDHFARKFAAGADSVTVKQLRGKAEDVHAPPMLRLELARLLHKHRELDAPLLRHLVSPSTPAPLRLLAVEALLACGESAQAMAALNDLARLPNREIALAVAEVAQRRLGLNFGLPHNQPLPPVQSRLAAEVARRVLAWATRHEADSESPPPAEVDTRVVDPI